MRRVGLLVVLVIVGVWSIAASAAQQAQAGQPRPAIRAIQKIKDNLYFISGGDTTDRPTWTGGNALVLVGERGVVLVDTMLPGFGQDILRQIRSITDKPVTTIVNTHTHYDHSGSNTEFAASVEFVAHESTRANMARETCDPVTNCAAFKGDNAKYLPKRTYKDRLTLFGGQDQIDLYHFGRGHTSGDSFVVFPAHRVMHAGDMFPRQQMPFVDVANSGGHAVEFNQTLQGAVSSIKGVDTVVGGHTPSPVPWSDFQGYTEFYRDYLASVQQSVKAGRSAEEYIKTYQLPEKYKGFLIDPVRLRDNTLAIYAAR